MLGDEEKKNAAGVITRVASPENKAIRKLDLLMGELKTFKNAAILRKGFLNGETQLLPQRRIKAKWASLYNMLIKYDRLRGPIARSNNFPDSVTELIPNEEEKVCQTSL